MTLCARLTKLEGKKGAPPPLCVFDDDGEGGYRQTDAHGVHRRYTWAEAEAPCGAGTGTPVMILIPCNGRDQAGC